MKLIASHAKLLADKVALSLANSEFVTLTEGLDPVTKIAEELILEDIDIEKEITAQANELLDKQEEEIEFLQADRRQLFWMIKRKVCEEENFSLKWDERLSDLSHHIFDELYEEDLINYHVSENRIRNVIYQALEDYLHRQEDIDNRVQEKIKNYKRKLVYGSDEYEIVYNKLYEEELRKLGM